MIRASALYIVIVIALVVAVICSAVIVAGYFYRAQYQKSFRVAGLQRNLESATNIILADTANTHQNGSVINLFEQSEDSVFIQRRPWGIFDIGVAKAFRQTDTLYHIFSIGNGIDTTGWAALYLIDEDRPISVSGKTYVRGNAFVPKAGIREAYVDGNGYEGDKRIVMGKIKESKRELPALNPQRITLLEKTMQASVNAKVWVPRGDTLTNSFMQPVNYLYLGKNVTTLHDMVIDGNIIIASDTTLTIDASATLSNVIIIAPGIVINKGFRGSGQFFAADSVSVGDGCVFAYPSCLATLRYEVAMPNKGRPLVSIGNGTTINGEVACWQKTVTSLSPLVKVGSNVTVKGQLYSQGVASYKDKCVINGGVYCGRFLYQSNFSAYENYLIGITIDAKKLSPYYLNGMLLPAATYGNKIMQWLERK